MNRHIAPTMTHVRLPPPRFGNQQRNLQKMRGNQKAWSQPIITSPDCSARYDVLFGLCKNNGYLLTWYWTLLRYSVFKVICMCNDKPRLVIGRNHPTTPRKKDVKLEFLPQQRLYSVQRLNVKDFQCILTQWEPLHDEGHSRGTRRHTELIIFIIILYVVGKTPPAGRQKECQLRLFFF